MEKIFFVMHRISAIIACSITFICVDLPLKVSFILFFIVLGLLASVFYPIIKNWEGPDFLNTWYDYTFKNTFICKKVWRAYIS